MQGDDLDRLVRVTVVGDGQEARLRLDAELPASMRAVDALKPIITGEGVEWTFDVQNRVVALLEEAGESAGPIERVIAEAQRPRHGEDGRIEWIVEDPSPAAPSAEDRASDASGEDSTGLSEQTVCSEAGTGDEEVAAGENGADRFNFYNQSAFVMVEKGQTLGHRVDPTEGEDGRSVTGRTLAARSGKSTPVRLDPTIIVAEDGRLTAAIDGRLVREPDRAYIDNFLEIRGWIDFSTGNIDFDGRVLIHMGVRDRFEVHATGDVEVRGPIEAAEVRTGGALVARGGMAGRDIGQIHIAADAHVRYLNQVRGAIRGELRVDRELIGCELEIRAGLVCPTGRVIGGSFAVAGPVELAHLGSPGAVPTELILGDIPQLQRKIRRIQRIRNKIEKRLEALEREQRQLAAPGVRPTAEQCERQTEILFEQQTLGMKKQEAEQTEQGVRDLIARLANVRLTVHGEIHPGVRLVVAGKTYRIDQPLSGPLTIRNGADGSPVLERGSQARPLHEVLDAARPAA